MELEKIPAMRELATSHPDVHAALLSRPDETHSHLERLTRRRIEEAHAQYRTTHDAMHPKGKKGQRKHPAWFKGVMTEPGPEAPAGVLHHWKDFRRGMESEELACIDRELQLWFRQRGQRATEADLLDIWAQMQQSPWLSDDIVKPLMERLEHDSALRWKLVELLRKDIEGAIDEEMRRIVNHAIEALE